MTLSGLEQEQGRPDTSGQASRQLTRSSGTHDDEQRGDMRSSISQKQQPFDHDPNCQLGMLRNMSTQSQQIPVRKVPRGSREGLLSSLSLLYEAQEPKHYPRSVKWFITLVIALAAVTGNMGASIMYRMSPLPSFQDVCNHPIEFI